MLQLSAFHHLTAVSANITANHSFYTSTLGLRLVKKSVNQDDTSAYHLFYADGVATPGTDLTFFDWPVEREIRGTRSISQTALRVRERSSLDWWLTRLDGSNVEHEPITQRCGRDVLDFTDFEGQRLSLVVDPTPNESKPWDQSPVPMEHQTCGLGPITLSVPQLEPTAKCLTEVLAMRAGEIYARDEKTRVHVFHMAGDGAASELHVAVEPHLQPARGGAGSVHHVAFRTTLKDYHAWAEHLRDMRIASSGPVDRFYFRSLYFREPNGILFEIATDEPGFTADEPLETLGQKLSLPPFLEPRRGQIEMGLKPI